MNIILVYAHKAITTCRPLGLLYIAACLEREGHTVHVIDPRPSDSITKIAEVVIRHMPDLIGFTCLTPDIFRALDIANEIKKEWQGPIVFGGVHPTICPIETLECECVDYVVIGEGEETMCELCQKLSNGKAIHDVRGIGYKKNGKPCLTPPRPLIENLDNLPFPARHLMPSKWYNSPKIRDVATKSTEIVMTGRGCLWNCIFCSSHLMWGRKVRRRSPENVMRELELLRSEIDIESVWFVDDTFTIKPEWVKHFCSLLIKENWKDFIWACQARVDTINREILSKMKRAGCVQVEYGVESGSEKVLKILRKGITPEQVKTAFRITKEVGLPCICHFYDRCSWGNFD